MSKEEDFELIRRFLDGYVPAYDRLVVKYEKMIFNLCIRILNDVDEGKDCAQETFIKVYRKMKLFQFRSAFSTWLYRIAVNTCKNRMNSLEYRRRKKTESIYLRERGGASTPESESEARETNAEILKAIGELPETQKILIVLRDIERKSYEEIGEITRLKPGTVKSKLYRARQELKKRLMGVIE